MQELEEMAKKAKNEYYRQWRAKNKDKVREANRKWREQNKDKINEINRRWREKTKKERMI